MDKDICDSFIIDIKIEVDGLNGMLCSWLSGCIGGVRGDGVLCVLVCWCVGVLCVLVCVGVLGCVVIF